MARDLRRSTDPYVRAHVYINPDLTPDEAKLAYERRKKRRGHGAGPQATLTDVGGLREVPSQVTQLTQLTNIPVPNVSFSPRPTSVRGIMKDARVSVSSVTHTVQAEVHADSRNIIHGIRSLHPTAASFVPQPVAASL